ncbi:Phosphatidylinositol-glycan-specific phospholipase D [Galemys pyrenaicus]|uniref:Phosphatidylinositol-glycan-specific phospholipase D n=1 Tax=Galemys pyrenaicus TaxID=202257 RepID=A0A8J6B6W5_GALPY|nr:Phosphatidylinositol-glycan-specific phospholipase D [Galemys pyrenaicus]
MSACRVWSGVLILLGTLCPGASPCGISTHVEIGHRALEFLHLQDQRVNYKELLLEHQDAYQAGTVFPDSFYPSICEGGKFHDVSESTHWTPFLNASIHYIRENYPLPWKEDTKKLVAFLFGITSHMVADISWHGLGIQQGFLRTMAAIDFHGSYSEAHSTGDFGGDVLSQSEFNFDYLARRWYVPVKDLLEIYKKLYGREVITKHAIIDCTHLQFLEIDCSLPENPLFISCGGQHNTTNGAFAVFSVSPILFFFFSSSKVQTNYFHRNLTTSLTKDTGRNITHTERGVFFTMDLWASIVDDASVLIFLCDFSVSEFHVLYVPDCGKEPTDNVQRAHSPVPETHFQPLSILLLVTSLCETWLASPRLCCCSGPSLCHDAWAMASADLNQDGYGDLVVGAPGYSHPGHIQVGRVYLIYGNDLGLPPVDLDLDKEAHGILEGFQTFDKSESELIKACTRRETPTLSLVCDYLSVWVKPSGRFGSALAVLDFNQDGLPDLAVGAPSVGSEELTYKGAVYIYFGSKEGRMSSPPNVTISCQDVYCNLGWTLLAADMNGDSKPDLVIGSPFAPGGGKQKGIVAAFYSDPSWSHKEQLNVEAANWMVRGEEDFFWLGYSLHGVSVNNRTLLLVGSPTWKNASSLGNLFRTQDEKQSLGRVYGYFPPNCQSQFTISGDKAMGKLGASLSSGYVMVNGTQRQVLLVGAPTHDDVSKMAFLTMTLHQGGTTRMYELTPDSQPSLLSTFSGDRRFSRFGGVLHLSDLDNDGLDEIIMAAPLRIADVTSGLIGGEDGRVYVYNGKQTTLGDMTGKCKSWFTPCPEEKAQYVLVSPEASSRFGSSMITVRSKKKTQVVIAAGRSSFGARLSGALHIYSLGLD